MMFLAATAVQAQITIGGNVYGGGNAGNLGGSTAVKVYAGTVEKAVYGGARQADVAGCAYVNIDGANMSDDIIINKVYGGNDISGSIGSLSAIGLSDQKPDERIEENGLSDVSTFILTTREGTASKHIFIGQLFGGGNGDYKYRYNEIDHSKFDVVFSEDNILYSIDKPNVKKTFVDLHGGTFGYAYAGGNNATVIEAAKICINNESTPWNLAGADKKAGTADDVISNEKLQKMGINTEFFDKNGKWNFASVFGGNNKAAMDIRPSWHLTNGFIENLYSGGNEGAMNSPDGILLIVQPDAGGELTVKNVFAGCRKAPVTPLLNGQTPTTESVSIDGYKFPKGLAARVLIYGGNITNVYGGNDITGKVTGGSALGIYSNIKGCVYGGGNGSYAYTDNPALKDSPLYGDFYYNVDSLLKQKYPTWKDGDFDKLATATEKGFKSAEALNLFRPNAEQVSLRLYGGDPDDPTSKATVIGGAVYLGGNSATLKPVKANDYRIELKIGSNVYSDSVFLANNGASMITEEILSRYMSTVKAVDGSDQRYSQMDFTRTDLDDSDKDETGHGKTTFAKYMDGVVMEAGPRVVFDGEKDDDPAVYKDYSTYFGSLYCGGNVGSMRNNATTEINVNYKVIIFDKLVGGSNKAYVPASDYNIEYHGGLLGNAPTGSPKLRLNLSGLKIQPKRWKNPNDKSQLLEWNTWIGDTKNVIDPTTSLNKYMTENGETYNTTADDLQRRFKGGNVYGGCYESGHVNGSVEINVRGSLVDREGQYGVFDGVEEDLLGEAILYGHQHYTITDRRSGVILDEQGMDVLGTSLNLFGGGYGKQSEIWGSTTINLMRGYVFQVFGGSQLGVIGKSLEDDGTAVVEDNPSTGADEKNYDYVFQYDDSNTSRVKHFKYDTKYSTVINLHGNTKGASKQAETREDLAECEFIYGGGFEGPIIGDTRINLGNGRVFNTFAGSCNADILGHTETYIGQWKDKDDNTVTGFPWVRDFTYGGNDLGGLIKGEKYYGGQLNSGTINQVHRYNSESNATPDVLTANAYTEYKQGRVGGIYGGCYGDYDYNDDYYWSHVKSDDQMPYMHNAFVNISPLEDNEDNKGNFIGYVHGAGQGHAGERRGDKMQDHSYVLIDIPDTKTFKDAVVFGAGSYNGLGMRTFVDPNTATEEEKDDASAIIDLVNGQINAVYGGSFQEGVTRRTVINVPTASTIKVTDIFGGAYGTQLLPPCDVYESNVNYKTKSNKARVNGAIYGGNNNERRTLYAHVNIWEPVRSDNASQKNLAIVYGAGQGIDTWTEYTEVNLENGAWVYEVYGGGQLGHVLNSESVQAYMKTYQTKPSAQIARDDPKWSNPGRWNGEVGSGTLKTQYADEWKKDWKNAWALGSYYSPNASFDNYLKNDDTNLSDKSIVRRAEMDDRKDKTYKYNTNVIVKTGAQVEGYLYGGGLGDGKTPMTGDVYGTTYVALLGGRVLKDIFAAGTSGAVYDLFQAKNFIASSNVYIEGGSLRNVYGGGWEGNVGYHQGIDVNGKYYAMAGPVDGDVEGETHVVIGIHEDQKNSVEGYGFLKGDPAIMRNAYGGGEGGAVFGTANLTFYNGHVGYVHLDELKMQDSKGAIVDAPADSDPEDYPERYEAKLNDETYYSNTTNEWLGENSLEHAGCIFGGGYIDNSSVDYTNVTMYGGTVRNAVFGGGEVAAVGRAVMVDGEPQIYKAGKTHVYLYEGHVKRNVFGGGRGYNNLGTHGTLDCDGYIFGQTEVNVFGGQVGTREGVAVGDGNVFGGGDVGYVYSAYKGANGSVAYGKKRGVRYDGLTNSEGYYYKFEGLTYNETNKKYTGGAYVSGYPMTEDCKVLIEPHVKVLTVPSSDGITIGANTYSAGQYVLTSDLNTLSSKTSDDRWTHLDSYGIIIHNAVFAGGNTKTGSSSTSANSVSVFGNATASIHDIYHRDLITLGTGHTGGLYGDGNLTLIDGYRELNITNYGTDYYTIKKEITIEEYHNLPDRESAYYELKYTCMKQCTDKDGTTYNPKDPDNENSKASTITADDLLTQFLVLDPNHEGVYISYTNNGVDILKKDADGNWVPNDASGAGFWVESGVLPVYAGRLMNSIQRADFCGVFGSRMVMQGAQDRVVEVTDFHNYTINRVREVSLNQQHSVLGNSTSGDLKLKSGKTPVVNFPADQDPDDFEDLDKAIHGNYFGIYNVVNYLGALTSDVHFRPGTDKRRTANTEAEYQPTEDDEKTYYQWKAKHVDERKRNNGTSFNKVALASGVYLELTTEKSTGKELREKDWGYITGVVELDLINVQTGIGGGFVYAKNVHGEQIYEDNPHAVLTELNKDAVTNRDYTYSTPTHKWQTSGNFIHSTQTIIDDCYNVSGKYEGDDAVPAHYWYIKGSVYVYDQKISAYTGAPNAYSETVDIPLTITAAAHGTMKLLDVKPNLYAYYASQGVPLQNDKKLIVNDVTYYKNDPISYWDWYLLSAYEKSLFVEDTYVTMADCKWSKEAEDTIPAGTVLLPNEYENYKGNHSTVYHLGLQKDVPFKFVFRSSNNLGHNTGYLLTYKVNNPTKWNTWYTEKEGAWNDKNQTGGDDYEDGPTYHLKDSNGAVLGQRSYEVGNLVSQDVEVEYQKILTNSDAASWVAVHVTAEGTKDQGTFEPAYLVTNENGITNDGDIGDWNYGYHINASSVADKQNDGSYVVKSKYAGSVAPAFICTSTIQMDKTEFIYLGTKMTETEKNGYITRVNTAMDEISEGASSKTAAQINAMSITDEKKTALLSLLDLKNDLTQKIQPAYYCISEGKYGGKWYEGGVNYRGLEAWSSMSEDDREMFAFNYDAFDLLIDTLYSRQLNDAGGKIYPEGKKYLYDGEGFTTEGEAKTNPAGYSLTQFVDYSATYDPETEGGELTLQDGLKVDVKHKDGTKESQVSKLKDGDELVREEFVKLPNEQRHYVRIKVGDEKSKSVTDGYLVYVVNAPFQIGNTPYSVGTILDANTYNGDKTNVTELTFATGDKDKEYYYCREKYEMGTSVTDFTRSDTPVAGTSIKGAEGGTVTEDGITYVKVGTIIASGTGDSQYGKLPNQQRNFVIHGISPTETSTLYVSRESDIYDLSKEKIISVIYEYDYDETDRNGNVTPVSERHVVNIHIEFKSGAPTVEDIKAPQLVLPGTRVGLREPNVTPGAYEVTGGGWDLFQTKSDSESHINEKPYNPATDSLYWYQNDWYIAYYATTYLGKTYSNAVQVSVANYHDLKKVMEAKQHHYYIDHKDVDRDPKIYINNYKVVDDAGNETAESKNGLDLLRQLYELSLLDENKVTIDEDGLIDKIKEDGVATETNSPYKGHAPLETSLVGGCENLELILRTNIDYSGEWTPIGTAGTSEDPCLNSFIGTLHGDGYYISGLDHSLFGNLCGNVYNLGVTGTFTSAGVADTGKGFVQNCWVKSSAATVDSNVKAVFGNPSDDNGTQVENCYYPESNAYSTTSHARGNARMMPDYTFYNGEVAYDLNGFYLKKRYYHGIGQSTGKDYYYLDANAGGTLPDAFGALPDEPIKGWYPADYAYYPLDEGKAKVYGYVENRFADGDYIYAGGFIPGSVDQRMRIVTEKDNDNKDVEKTIYAPIWPDDYLYFGQALNYGHIETRTHQEVPSHINRTDDRIDTTETCNRVYRAPAYYRNSKMSVAHFNTHAVFAASKKDVPTVKAYKNMTAIDFTGKNDMAAYQDGLYTNSSSPYKGLENGAFFPPLLDDGGVRSFKNVDLTKNLLAYTVKNSADGHSNDACNMTDATINAALGETSYNETNATYRTVAYSDPQYTTGHWIQKSGDDYFALRDHQLVDKHDFYAPIGYTFATGKRMWYQRDPDNFAGQERDMDINGKPVFRNGAGWESISLPFTAELVTTDVKGEITHFYNGANADESTNDKGHEYWLREYDGKVEKSEKTGNTTDAGVYVANFARLNAVTGYDKEVTNTFLWDYYYLATEGHDQLDRNSDTYQTYYNAPRTYTSYPKLQAGTPYIIGFPGARYYEFDLSGGFEAFETTATYLTERPEPLFKQIITFASNTGTSIAASDVDMKGVVKDGTSYRFYPNYLNIEIPAGGYVMTYNGDGYDQMTDALVAAEKNKVSAFRTYFSTSTTPQMAARRIIFSEENSQLGADDGDGDIKDKLGESMDIRPGNHSVIVTSNLKNTADVRIFNVGGLCVANFNIEPGQTIETRVDNAGIYIVQPSDGRYTKKVSVR